MASTMLSGSSAQKFRHRSSVGSLEVMGDAGINSDGTRIPYRNAYLLQIIQDSFSVVYSPSFLHHKMDRKLESVPISTFQNNVGSKMNIFQRLTVEVTMCVGRFIYHEKMLEFTYQREHSNAWNSAQNSSTCLLEKDRIRGLEATTEFINGVLCL